MATREEKQKLFDALSFTPRTYTISIWGYGGEIVMGRIERKFYDYFKHRRLDVADYAWNYEYAEEHNIPEEFQPFEPGSWYDCDDMAHASGASMDAGTLQILDENDEVIIESQLEEIDGEDGIQLVCDNEAWVGMIPPGEVAFVGRSNEKGTFFGGKIELTRPFDSSKLTIYYDDVDGEEYVSGIYYDDEEIENNGANTNGKSSDFGLYLVNEDKSWESYIDQDSIKYPLTEWIPKKTNPLREGNYLIKTAGKDSYEYQAKWTGSRWINSWYEDIAEVPDLKIKAWRGITQDPDTFDFMTPTVSVEKKVVANKKVELNPNASWPF